MAEKITIHDRNLNVRLSNLHNWGVPDSVKTDITRFMAELAIGRVNPGRRISVSRQLKYLDLLRIPLEYFNKPCEKLTLKNIEAFEKDLSSGKIISQRKGSSYKPTTQTDIRKALKIFIRWKLGKSKALNLVGWLDTRDPRRTPDYLKEAEIISLYQACSQPWQRFLITVLFDSGARAEELHNIRMEDIDLPEKNGNFVRLTLKEEYSKTKGRTISLYWPHTLESVKAFFNQRKLEGANSEAPVFNKKYDATRQFLIRLGKRVLGRSLHCHLFRHSSATYYANKLNRQELCYRYGWAFSSNMPDVYISRAGMQTKELDEKFTQTELGEMKLIVQTQQMENARLKEEHTRMNQKYDALSHDLIELKQLLMRYRNTRKLQVEQPDPKSTAQRSNSKPPLRVWTQTSESDQSDNNE